MEDANIDEESVVLEIEHALRELEEADRNSGRSVYKKMIFSVLPSTYLCCTYTINYEVLVLHIVCTFNYERAGGENRVQRNNCIVRHSTTIPDCGMAAYLTIQWRYPI